MRRYTKSGDACPAAPQYMPVLAIHVELLLQQCIECFDKLKLQIRIFLLVQYSLFSQFIPVVVLLLQAGLYHFLRFVLVVTLV